MRTLQTHAPVIFSVIIFFLTCFRLSRRIRHVCVLVLIHFQQRFQIDAFFFYENARRISVDGRPKRVEMYAFWNRTALVWKVEDCWFLPLLAINVFNSVLFLLPVPPEASSTLHVAFFWLKAWRHRLLCHGVFFSDSRARPSRPWSSLWQLFRASAKDQLDA